MLLNKFQEIEEENAMGLYVRYSDALKSSQAADQKAKAAVVARYYFLFSLAALL